MEQQKRSCKEEKGKKIEAVCHACYTDTVLNACPIISQLISMMSYGLQVSSATFTHAHLWCLFDNCVLASAANACEWRLSFSIALLPEIAGII